MSARSRVELCAVCSSAAAKYKCANCYIRYCSVKCFKDHKTTESCVAPEKKTNNAAPVRSAATQSARSGAVNPDVDEEEEEARHRLTAQDLAKLDGSDDVKQLLMNPNIRAMADAVRNDQNPVEAIRMLRQRADFEELVQALINATSSDS